MAGALYGGFMSYYPLCVCVIPEIKTTQNKTKLGKKKELKWKELKPYKIENKKGNSYFLGMLCEEFLISEGPVLSLSIHIAFMYSALVSLQAVLI